MDSPKGCCELGPELLLLVPPEDEWCVVVADEGTDTGGSGGPRRSPAATATWCGYELCIMALIWCRAGCCKCKSSCFGFMSNILGMPECCDDREPIGMSSRFFVCFRSFARRFWNQILTCRSDRPKDCASSVFLRIVMYRDVWYSFSSSNRW